jgi:plasmid stabilization system protein ParE
MARITPKLTIEYTVESIADLDKVWDWNAEQYDEAHASRYIEFLKKKVGKLVATNYPGKPVPTHESYRYEILKRRSRGHGHLAVFQIVGSILRILRFYHSSQDWQKKIAKDQE